MSTIYYLEAEREKKKRKMRLSLFIIQSFLYELVRNFLNNRAIFAMEIFVLFKMTPLGHLYFLKYVILCNVVGCNNLN